jgi:hypothetical protein
MPKAKNAPTNKEAAVAVEQPEPNHTEKIKSQVLAKIGKPPRLDRVEVSRHHNGKYRVNVWQQREPDASISISTGSRIGPSYYLTVSDKGEIIRSDPPLAKVGSPA